MGWNWLYETNFGLFNYILKSMGIENVRFLVDPKYVLPSLAVISVWLSGNLIVIFLAGLQNVPRVYHEAAEIDGANGFQRFLHVTLPCMSPIISIIFDEPDYQSADHQSGFGADQRRPGNLLHLYQLLNVPVCV